MSDTLTQTTPARPSGWHPVNIGHLVMGLAFLGLVGIWALIQSDVVDGDEIRWLLPVPWVIAGIAGLVAAAVTGTRRHGVRQTGWVDHRPDGETDTDTDTYPVADNDSEADGFADDPEENR